MVEAPPHQPAFLEAIVLVFRTVGRHFRACLRLAAIYALAAGLVNGLTKAALGVEPSSVSASEVAFFGVAVFAAIGAVLLVNVFLYPVTVGALSLVGSAEVYDDAIDPHGIIRQAIDHALEAVGTFLLTLLILIVAPIAVGLIALVVDLATSPVAAFGFSVFALALLIVPTIYVAVRLSLAVPVVMRESVGPMDALRRSWELVHGTRWWWTFGVTAVSALFGAALFALTSGLLSPLLPWHGLPGFISGVVIGAVQTAGSVILVGVAVGVVYASLTPETVAIAALEAGAHEVLPEELPPVADHRPFEEPPPAP